MKKIIEFIKWLHRQSYKVKGDRWKQKISSMF